MSQNGCQGREKEDISVNESVLAGAVTYDHEKVQRFPLDLQVAESFVVVIESQGWHSRCGVGSWKPSRTKSTVCFLTFDLKRS